jgi:hypothetical protein
MPTISGRLLHLLCMLNLASIPYSQGDLLNQGAILPQLRLPQLHYCRILCHIRGRLLPTQIITTKHPQSSYYYSQSSIRPDNADHEDVLRRPVQPFPKRFSKSDIHNRTNDSWVSKGQVPGCGRIQVRSCVVSVYFPRVTPISGSEEVRID